MSPDFFLTGLLGLVSSKSEAADLRVNQTCFETSLEEEGPYCPKRIERNSHAVVKVGSVFEALESEKDEMKSEADHENRFDRWTFRGKDIAS